MARCLHKGYGGGREARSASQASACAVRPLLHMFKACSQYRSLITQESSAAPAQVTPLTQLRRARTAKAKRALGFLVPFLVLVSCIFYNEVTTPWTALDALFFGPR